MSEKNSKKHRRRINRCVECKNPLRHIQNNQWMCDQAPSKCNFSAKVVWLSNVIEEEE